MKVKKSIPLFILLLTLMLLAIPETAFASEQLLSVDGNWIYTVIESEATIVRYQGELEEVIIPSTIDGYTVTALNSGSFAGIQTITSVKVPDTVTSLGESVFSGCTNLTSIDLPNTLTYIGNVVFKGCTSLTSIDLPDTVTSLGESVFSGCTNLTSIDLPNTLTSIGNWAFQECTNLTSIELPDTVTSTGEAVFLDCTSLETVTLSNSLEAINRGLFVNCTKLKAIIIPASVTSIGSEAFRGCPALEDFTILGNPTLTGSFLVPWGEVSNLKHLNISGNMTTIPSNSFQNLKSLTTLTLGEGIQTIEYSAFSNNTSLSEINIPNSVKTIGMDAFNGCTGVTNLNLGEGLTSIRTRAFSGLSSLTYLEVPGSVIHLDTFAFEKMGIETLTFKENQEGETLTLPYLLTSQCNNLTTINFPASPYIIESHAFSDLPELTTVNLKHGLISIGDFNFRNSKVTSIDFPSTLRTMDNADLLENSQITEIYFRRYDTEIFSRGGNITRDTPIAIYGYAGSTAEAMVRGIVVEPQQFTFQTMEYKQDSYVNIRAKATIIDITVTPNISIIIDPNAVTDIASDLIIENNSTAPIHIISTSLEKAPDGFFTLVAKSKHEDWIGLGKADSKDLAFTLTLTDGWKNIVTEFYSTGVDGDMEGTISPKETGIIEMTDLSHGYSFEENQSESIIITWLISLE